jgi:hypothetical protein
VIQRKYPGMAEREHVQDPTITTRRIAPDPRPAGKQMVLSQAGFCARCSGLIRSGQTAMSYRGGELLTHSSCAPAVRSAGSLADSLPD